MSDTNETTPDTSSSLPSATSTAALALLGALNAMWAVFLWGELLLTRAGGSAFCAMSDTVNCSALWDGPFASSVHSITKVPIAGWGLIFGLVSFLLPLIALAKRDDTPRSVWTGIRLVGAAGALTVIALLLVSAKEGALCLGCLGTYVLVGVYAFISLASWKTQGFDDVGPAAGQAGAMVGVLFLAMLYPGIHTPMSADSTTKSTVAAMKDSASASSSTKQPTHDGHAHAADDGHDHAKPAPVASVGHGLPKAPEGKVTVDEGRIRAFLSSLPPPALQALSDTLYTYRTSTPVAAETPRLVIGGESKLQIVDWTDVRCGHCSKLHEVLAEIYKTVPKGSFNVESRHFPLDGNCNKDIQRRSPDGLNCIAAKAQICMEQKGADALFAYSGTLFKNQRTLTVDNIYQAASKWMPQADLKACIESPETDKKLQDDIAYAMKTRPEGTPVVIINGKKANGFPPLLFALILAQGNADLDVFKGLPPPNPNAHVH